MKIFRIGIFVLILLLSFQIKSQNFSWGVKSGLIYGTPYTKPEKGSSGTLGLGPHIGIFAEFKFNDKLSFQPQIIYSRKNGTYKTLISGDTIYKQIIMSDTFYIPTYYKGNVEGKFTNNYLDFPLLAKYKLKNNFSLLFGPQVSYLLKGGNKGNADVEVGENYSKIYDEPFDISDKINRWDYSIVIGNNYETKNRINFDVNFSFGLRSIFINNYEINGTVRNIYLSGSIGYRFK